MPELFTSAIAIGCGIGMGIQLRDFMDLPAPEAGQRMRAYDWFWCGMRVVGICSCAIAPVVIAYLAAKGRP